MKLYFIRHGQSETNFLNILYNRGIKYGLTQKGKMQVQTLAEKIGELKIDKIYTSPLLRAVETTEILSQKLCIPYEITSSLSEFDVGTLENKGDEKTFQIEQHVVQEWLLRKNWDARFEDGESYNDIDV